MIGMTPFFGAHFVSALVLASLLGWNKIAAFAGVNITNVLTAPLIYPLNYWVGLNLVGISRGVTWPTALQYHEMLNLVRHSPLILIDLTIGGMVLGAPLAVIAYLLALRAFRHYRQRRCICSLASPLPDPPTGRRS
jgi:uncharacterized protein (DUF2062 family)